MADGENWIRANSTNWRRDGRKNFVGKHRDCVSWEASTLKQSKCDCKGLPGSIVAANNKDGRHRTIILFKSNIMPLVSVFEMTCNNPLFLVHCHRFRFCLRERARRSKALHHLFMNLINKNTVFPHQLHASHAQHFRSTLWFLQHHVTFSDTSARTATYSKQLFVLCFNELHAFMSRCRLLLLCAHFRSSKDLIHSRWR